MEKYECDIVMRPLEKKIRDFTQWHGYDLTKVFGDLLDYIIAFLDIEGKPLHGWQYSQEDNEAFYDMMTEYFLLMQEILKKRLWYDAWGDLFMALHPKGGGRGQFFTPDDMCNLMAEITLKEYPEEKTYTTFGRRVIVNDCSAGSSRNLLAAHAVFVKNGWRKPYLSAEDIDYTCCKMSAVNMAVHGCFGEVICHDTLTEPDTLRCGYVINEGLWPLEGLPTIRKVTDAKNVVSIRQWVRIKQEKQTTDRANASAAFHSGGDSAATPKETKQPQQLSLW